MIMSENSENKDTNQIMVSHKMAYGRKHVCA